MSDSTVPPSAPAPAKKRGCGFWVMVVFAVIVGLGIFGSLLPKPAVDPATVPSTPQAAAAATKISAADLRAAYAANEVAAKQRFDGQMLEVTGTIDSIDLDFSDDPVVRFKTGEMFEWVSANFSEGASAAIGGLSKGQKATVRCPKVSEALGSPILMDCVLVADGAVN